MSSLLLPAALCVGHPGHELRVFGWMECHRPLVNVFTDGSGSDRVSRFGSTRNLIQGAGGRLGFLQGTFSDRVFYQMIMDRDPSPFIELARKLALEWEREGIKCVAGDKIEGFNTTHDLCRMMINAAVEKLRRRGRCVVNLEFPLESMTPPEACPGMEVLHLDDAQFERKRAATLLAYPELASEVFRLIEKHGEHAFRTEVLTPAAPLAGLTWEAAEPPYYETYGQKQVEAGHYRQVIRFEDHIRPLAFALWQWAESDEP